MEIDWMDPDNFEQFQYLANQNKILKESIPKNKNKNVIYTFEKMRK